MTLHPLSHAVNELLIAKGFVQQTLELSMQSPNASVRFTTNNASCLELLFRAKTPEALRVLQALAALTNGCQTIWAVSLTNHGNGYTLTWEDTTAAGRKRPLDGGISQWTSPQPRARG